MTTPSSYFPSQFFVDMGGEAPSREAVAAIAEEMLAVYGGPCLPRLAELLAFCVDPPDRCLGEFCPWPKNDWLPPPDGNAFEFLLEEPFRLYPAFGDTLAIGSTGSGDLWTVALEPCGEDNQVYLCEHDECYALSEVADSLPTFAFLNHLLEVGDPSPEDVAALAGRVSLKRDVTLEPSPETPFLSTLGVKETYALGNDLAACLDDCGPAPPTERLPDALVEEVMSHRSLLPARPLIALWTKFFQRQDDPLATLLTACAQHRGRLVRDTATVLQEVLAGRKEVGVIDDIHALRS